MAERLNWIDVLNEQATWSNSQDLLVWYESLTGRAVAVSKKCLEEFQECLTFIRSQASALHFQEKVDTESIGNRLIDLSLELAERSLVDKELNGKFPMLHARIKGKGDAAILRALQETLLMQFAFFVAESLDNSQPQGLARCEGLYREPAAKHLAPAESLPEEVELRWRKEISVLVENGLDCSPEIMRCADFFLARPKGRFCSDECRFRTFQVTKQLSAPNYLADKQKRYRQRLDK